MKFQVHYYIRKTEKITIGFRGKPLKTPRTRLQFIHLSEILEAVDLEKALQIGLLKAKENSWILEEVSEVKKP